MLLACDIGNTNIKSGLFSGNALTEFFIFSSPEEFTTYASGKKISSIVVSSVVPDKLQQIKSKLNKATQVTEISLNSPFNLRIEYNSAATLGIDRLCSCEGAFFLYSNSDEFRSYNPGIKIITIDFGTATTINFVRYPGIFEGGIIAPGVQLMNASLNSGTAQLPQVYLKDYKSLIGKTTAESIASGIVNSTTGLIEKTIKDIKRENSDAEIKIFITGGNTPKLAPFLDFEYNYEKALVLFGIKAVSNLILHKL